MTDKERLDGEYSERMSHARLQLSMLMGMIERSRLIATNRAAMPDMSRGRQVAWQHHATRLYFLEAKLLAIKDHLDYEAEWAARIVKPPEEEAFAAVPPRDDGEYE